MKAAKNIVNKASVLRDFEASLTMLNVNFAFLAKLDNSFWNKALWDPTDLSKLAKLNNFYLKEYSRLLHNYLSSFVSFVDHTQAIIVDMGKLEIEKEYWEQRKKWKTEKTAFVKDLHNFAHHKKLPMAYARLALMMVRDETIDKIGKQEGVFSEAIAKMENVGWRVDGVNREQPCLSVPELLTWRNWKADSKIFLNGCRIGITIMPLISEAHKNTLVLSDWVYAKIKSW